jgi:hypothetical protein
VPRSLAGSLAQPALRSSNNAEIAASAGSVRRGRASGHAAVAEEATFMLISFWRAGAEPEFAHWAINPSCAFSMTVPGAASHVEAKISFHLQLLLAQPAWIQVF